MSEHEHQPVEVEPHWFDAYDNPPERGPAIFAVTVGEATDRGGSVELPPDGLYLQQRLIAAVGMTAVHDGSWRIIDQLDLGKVMVDEDLTTEELGRLAKQAAAGLLP